MRVTVRDVVTGICCAALAACGGKTTEPGPEGARADAARSELVATPASATADGASQVVLAATARDPAGRVLAGRPASFDVTGVGTTVGATAMLTGPDGVATVAVVSTVAGSVSGTVALDGVAVTQQASGAFVAGPAAVLQVQSLPSSLTAGTERSVTVTARDAHANVVKTYAGTVHFATADSIASVPPDYAFQPADEGVRAFAVTLRRAGAQTLTATDTSTSSVTGSQDTTVSAAAPSTFEVSVAASTTTAGETSAISVTALDPYGNVATDYTGTVHLASTDGSAVLPLDYTFTGSDGGAHSFTSAVTLSTAGAQTLTATDLLDPTLAGTAPVTVTSGTPDHLAFVVQPSSIVAGGTISPAVEVEVLDAYGNRAT